jgi:hypothetical protein|tara:strand:- start:22 stop:168 length:147 start_codon:yes stop_codon:yes gene_type:complete
MRRIRIVINKISRYQFEKELGATWRRESVGETFTDFRKRVLKERKKNK